MATGSFEFIMGSSFFLIGALGLIPLWLSESFRKGVKEAHERLMEEGMPGWAFGMYVGSVIFLLVVGSILVAVAFIAYNSP